MRSIITAWIVFAFTGSLAAAPAVQPDDGAKIDACLKNARERPEPCTGQFLKPVLARGGPKKRRVEAAE